jgi:hypothetical protein
MVVSLTPCFTDLPAIKKGVPSPLFVRTDSIYSPHHLKPFEMKGSTHPTREYTPATSNIDP